MSNPQPEKVRVVVGDDHPLFREGVVRALSLSGSVNVVGEADDGAAALELIKAHLPDVAGLPHARHGRRAVAAAVRSYELPTRVLLISAHDEPAIVYQALQQGAAGFLLKDSTRTEIVKAVLDCAKGRDVVAPSLVGGLAGEIRQRAAPVAPVLSAHRQVLNRIACGQSIPAIAAELYVAPSTVKTHVQRLYEKLGVSDRAAAVAEAMRQRLLD
ncbi:nitrate/nitrite response transcriptionalregulatory protein [Mycobacterium tuberculosis CAS/NITR204]|uniref:Nitrate/nitrite response transcriptionalregulatory protein n=1 Tax=Mycobacterium tuberculosis CAS/NITR204 TaxID=1310114 RepID=R4MFU7_MYCTX|nr:nitrate/nitrite response transcriptionalregulatory protein [Mycobacterium tuberculosis CAS/NITR204]